MLALRMNVEKAAKAVRENVFIIGNRLNVRETTKRHQWLRQCVCSIIMGAESLSKAGCMDKGLAKSRNDLIIHFTMSPAKTTRKLVFFSLP
jgi:hypothetical protein